MATESKSEKKRILKESVEFRLFCQKAKVKQQETLEKSNIDT